MDTVLIGCTLFMAISVLARILNRRDKTRLEKHEEPKSGKYTWDEFLKDIYSDVPLETVLEKGQAREGIPRRPKKIEVPVALPPDALITATPTWCGTNILPPRPIVKTTSASLTKGVRVMVCGADQNRTGLNITSSVPADVSVLPPNNPLTYNIVHLFHLDPNSTMGFDSPSTAGEIWVTGMESGEVHISERIDEHIDFLVVNGYTMTVDDNGTIRTTKTGS